MVSGLKKYNAKRNFKKTSEPKGKKEKSKSGFSYLIQKHAASHLHYDFRLELDGTLKSWAVTKGPSLDPEVKRLAVEVEDHPVSYGSFEGTIPKGQYGGGTVMLWDVGSWEAIGDPRAGLKKGHLSFILHGERLKGEWALIRMKWSEKEGKNNWLLIKKDDKFAKSGDKDKLLTKHITSVTTGRKMDEIAEQKKKVWKGEVPKFIPPQLATLSDKTPTTKNWIHEIKFDGYRAQAHVNSGEVKIFTRNGLDWTEKFQSIADELKKFPNAILDGEIVALDEKKRSNFLKLQEVLKEEKSDELQFYLFDLLFLDGEKIAAKPLLTRKEKLKKIFDEGKFERIFYSEHFEYRGEKFLQKLCDLNFEGIISKLADKAYFSGRNKDWLKTKCHKRQEFVIGGFKLPSNGSKGVGSILLGVYEGKDFVYCGKVGTGFSQKTSQELRQKLEKLRVEKSPFKDISKGGIWVKPQLVCEIEFTEWTSDSALRHGSFQGLRGDKPAREIVREKAIKNPAFVGVTDSLAVSPSEIKITHPERIIFPKKNLTKLDLVEYYDAISDRILPHLKNRYVSLVRCPEGLKGECFFQRHQGSSKYFSIQNKKDLLQNIQMGAIEIHVWGSLIDKISQPDRLIFDLDPDPKVPWKKVIEAAAEVKLRMDDLGLESFLKTTGGKGLHVVIPIKRKHEWDEVKAFAKKFAEEMVADSPEKYVSNMNKAKRKGKIFIDYLRNDETATAVSAFSARARENATVAMPLSWHDLNEKLDPQKFTIENALEFLKQQKSDPWAEIWKIKKLLI